MTWGSPLGLTMRPINPLKTYGPELWLLIWAFHRATNLGRPVQRLREPPGPLDRTWQRSSSLISWFDQEKLERNLSKYDTNWFSMIERRLWKARRPGLEEKPKARQVSGLVLRRLSRVDVWRWRTGDKPVIFAMDIGTNNHPTQVDLIDSTRSNNRLPVDWGLHLVDISTVNLSPDQLSYPAPRQENKEVVIPMLHN